MPDRLLVDLGEGGRAVVSSWPDGGLPEEVARAPLEWPLNAPALEDLRCYLEDYLLAPYGVWEDRGPAVAGKLAGWGKEVFASVFGSGPARDAYQRARDGGLEVVFRSNDPGLLGLPWELMRDGSGPVALEAGGISRALPVADRAPLWPSASSVTASSALSPGQPPSPRRETSRFPTSPGSKHECCECARYGPSGTPLGVKRFQREGETRRGHGR